MDGINVTGEPEYKRAAYLGRVFQDPMTRYGGDDGDSGEPGNGCRAVARRERLAGVSATKEKEEYREMLKILDLGLEDQPDEQSWSAVRWPKTGADSSDGNVEKAEASASG